MVDTRELRFPVSDISLSRMFARPHRHRHPARGEDGLAPWDVRPRLPDPLVSVVRATPDVESIISTYVDMSTVHSRPSRATAPPGPRSSRHGRPRAERRPSGGGGGPPPGAGHPCPELRHSNGIVYIRQKHERWESLTRDLRPAGADGTGNRPRRQPAPGPPATADLGHNGLLNRGPHVRRRASHVRRVRRPRGRRHRARRPARRRARERPAGGRHALERRPEPRPPHPRQRGLSRRAEAGPRPRTTRGAPAARPARTWRARPLVPRRARAAAAHAREGTAQHSARIDVHGGRRTRRLLRVGGVGA